jgi:hypothetical protein
MWQATADEGHAESFAVGFHRRKAALLNAYARHREEYQQEYEGHVNWEFAEDELRDIVHFLERPAGRHFLDGRWRMEAYVGTNTKKIEEQIVKEAVAALARK